MKGSQITPERVPLFHQFKEFLEPIGRLVIAFSGLEQAIGACLRAILRLSAKELTALLKRMESTNDVILLLKDVVNLNISDPQLKNEILDMISAAKHANEFRNQIIHDVWVGVSWQTPVGGSEEERSEITALKLKYGNPRTYKLARVLAEMENMVLLILNMSSWAVRFSGKGGVPAPSLPYKSPQQLELMK